MWLKRLLSYLQKKVKCPLARPRTVKVFGGEVILRNLPKDKQDMIADYIEALEASSPAEESKDLVILPADHEAATKVLDSMDSAELKDTALAIKVSDGSYSLVSVKYNLETKEAQVSDVVQYDKRDRLVIQADFRSKAAKLFMG